MDQEAAQLEKQHVHHVYESTARYLSDLQGKAWPRVRQFLQDQEPGSLIADIGCGTGKYLKVNSQVHTLGCDYCGPLVEIARSRGCEVMVCDNLDLPFRDQGFDAIISIGVIHHFSTKQRRIRAIKEMARMLVPGGQLMIYVWAMEQKHRRFEKQDVLVPWNRALCPRLLSEGSPPGRRKPGGLPERSHPYPPPGTSGCTCSVCFRERRDARRSHSADYEPGRARTCCASVSKEAGAENGFYNTLGRSFRSWFCSRSLDESSLQKQVERGRSLKNTDGWASSTVSIQPARHISLDRDPREPSSAREQSSDEDVFVETSQKHVEWLRAPATGGHPGGDPRGETGRDAGGEGLGGTHPTETCAAAGVMEEGQPSARRMLTRVSTLDSTDSLPDDTITMEGQQPGALDSGAFMRYYHVFREGELCGLLRENVSELHILSSGNDHGNWCIIAEKKEACG